MPIRLVVAITVGTAAMSMLVPMLDAVEETERHEVTVEPDSKHVVLDTESPERVTVDVVTADGQPVQESTVVFSAGSAPLTDGPYTVETGPDSNRVTVRVGESPVADLTVDFRTTQRRGTIEIGVVPPADEAFSERADHPEITVSKQG